MDIPEILEAMRECLKVLGSTHLNHEMSSFLADDIALAESFGRDAIAALEGMQKAHEQVAILACGSLDEAVNRFLGWRLPEDFCPDAGISFKPEYNVEYMAKQGLPPSRHEPTGTNLFNADQARQMIEYILGIPAAPKPTGEE